MKLDGKDRESVTIGYGATDIVAVGDSVWITSDLSQKLVRINGRTRALELDRPLSAQPRLIAPGPGGSVLVAEADDDVSPAVLVRYDRAGNAMWTRPFARGISAMIWARDRAWVAEGSRERVVPVRADGTLERHLNTDGVVDELAYGSGRLWGSVKDTDAIEYSDMRLRNFFFEEFRGSPAQIAAAHDRMFVARKGLHVLSTVRVRGRRLLVENIRRRMPRNPYAVTAAAGHIWVTSLSEDSLARIDW
jgi:streptogramin lyase